MKPPVLRCCLLCARVVKHRGWASHQRSKSHRDQGDRWWTYNRMLRVAMLYYHRRVLEQLNDELMARVEPPDAMPAWSGKTVQWYRYSLS